MRKRQLEREPWCVSCKRQGKTRRATVADHIIPHRDSPSLFWRGKLQSMCASCHSRHKQREELHGFSDELGSDGWPVDPAHPFNRASSRAEELEARAGPESQDGADASNFND